jgi:hypothetical protein
MEEGKGVRVANGVESFLCRNRQSRQLDRFLGRPDLLSIFCFLRDQTGSASVHNCLYNMAETKLTISTKSDPQSGHTRP